MRRLAFVLFTLAAALLGAGTGRAQITTVILSQDSQSDFSIAEPQRKTPYPLKFPIDQMAPLLPKDINCELSVVALPPSGNILDQSVSILSADTPVGRWSVYNSDTKQRGTAQRVPVRLTRPLAPGTCKPGAAVALDLVNKSSDTNWKYYGGTAADVSARPRLLLTYGSAAGGKSVRRQDSTEWKYHQPNGFFQADLSGGKKALLTNPVALDGAVYFVASAGGTPNLFRAAGPGNIANWPLGFDIAGRSFAFATGEGRLEIVTRGGIGSCGINSIENGAGEAACLSVNVCDPKVEGNCAAPHNLEYPTAVNRDEPPAMGQDGSLYLKDLRAGGAIVGYNPLLREIWHTGLVATKVSRMALTADGRYLFALADADPGSATQGKGFYLLRIDTATGETVPVEITVPEIVVPETKSILTPLLTELFRPAVISKEVGGVIIDYVFVAANDKDTGYFQLYRFERGTNSRALKIVYMGTKMRKVATAPLPSTDGKSVFIVLRVDKAEPARLMRFDWWGTNGAKFRLPDGTCVALPDGTCVAPTEIGNGKAILATDGAGAIYLYADTNTMLRGFAAASKPFQRKLPGALDGLFFTGSGALIGYTDQAVDDLSPRTDGVVSVNQFDPLTIYSADIVTAAKDAAAKLSGENDKLILKGHRVVLPNGFTGPVHRTLEIQSVDGNSKSIDSSNGFNRVDNGCAATETHLTATLFPNEKRVIIFGNIIIKPNCTTNKVLNDSANVLYTVPDNPANFCPALETMLARREDSKQQINIEPAACRIFIFPPSPGGGEFSVNTAYTTK